MDEKARIFEEHRRMLEGIAYRMLGTLTDAQDVVQDTYLKWSRADRSEIDNPRSWLVTVCSRLALDLLKSARVRRETYIGPWLPEPFRDEPSPDARLRTDETVSLALMRLPRNCNQTLHAAGRPRAPLARVFPEPAVILNKSSAACRKLASRARASVQSDKPRFHATPEEHQRLLDAFLKAAYAGDLNDLQTVLAEAVELHADGGGKAVTAPEVLRGTDAVASFFVRVMHDRKPRQTPTEIVTRWFNGVPGVLIYEAGRLVVALSVAIESGRIHRIYALRNPDKLAVFNRRNA